MTHFNQKVRGLAIKVQRLIAVELHPHRNIDSTRISRKSDSRNTVSPLSSPVRSITGVSQPQGRQNYSEGKGS
ncbi:hypothetical protein [Microseira wollei]|uniref:hypothetical protein n=1 Tax=Microseira wollei TaxID=467598 RepID=UPI001CFE6CF2|nr:hypothetical protein [Microseira wollei]